MMYVEQVTHGMRVGVQPRFVLSESDPSRGRFVFTYDIEIENMGVATGTLLRRHWTIEDEGGPDTEVDGDGVIGVQPTLEPGAVHRYQSFCVLRSPRGAMEGHYTFVRPDGEEFRVEVPRFRLDAGWFGMGTVSDTMN